jgi:hypothetical protein
MFNKDRSDDYTPLAVIGQLPIYLTEILIALHVAAMVTASACAGFSVGEAWTSALVYNPLRVLGEGHVWRLFSYVFLEAPPAGFGPVIFFLMGLLILWWCGRQMEQFYGSRNFLKCYVILTILPAMVALVPGLRTEMAGPEMVHFGIFILFAATYPGVQLFFGIPAKWIGWAFLFFNTLVYFARRNPPELLWLWISAATAYALTRWLGRGDWLPHWTGNWRLFRSKPKFEVVEAEPAPAKDPVSSIDPILEKIARSGLASLSAKEHAALRAASGELQKKSGR